MSTKVTVKHGDKYHLYKECFEGKHVYLSLTGVNFDASPKGITVEIPRTIWNEIVKAGEINPLSDAEMDEEEWGGCNFWKELKSKKKKQVSKAQPKKRR